MNKIIHLFSAVSTFFSIKKRFKCPPPFSPSDITNMTKTPLHLVIGDWNPSPPPSSVSLNVFHPFSFFTYSDKNSVIARSGYVNVIIFSWWETGIPISWIGPVSRCGTTHFIWVKCKYLFFDFLLISFLSPPISSSPSLSCPSLLSLSSRHLPPPPSLHFLSPTLFSSFLSPSPSLSFPLLPYS